MQLIANSHPHPALRAAPAAVDSKLEEKIRNRSALLAVIGMGYVGLPLVRTFIEAGYRAVGFDVDADKIAQLRQGQSYIKHIASPWIADCVAHGKLRPTTDPLALHDADAILICVPTPLNGSRDPDLSYIEQTGEQLARQLRPGQLIVLESTTYPGTTREVLLPILESSGLIVERDFFLAFSPEREDPGNPDFTAATIPKVVGGLDPTSLRLATALYGAAMPKVVPVSNCEAAEACKILENTYRAVNIALVNELKVLFARMDLDIWEVIEAARTKPFGFQAFFPGPGLGGHCIPIDPFYLTWLARRLGMNTRFIELAGEINTSMPHYVLQRISEALSEHGQPLRGSRIALLGAAYKRDVDDPRESPTFTLMELLLERRAVISYNDPHIPRLPPMRRHHTPLLESQSLTPEYLRQQDCVVIVTDHSAYDYDFIVDHSRLVVDTRNAARDIVRGREKIYRA